jgi:NADPH:quinone reductase-like Zn-dependent oxidoreductase
MESGEVKSVIDRTFPLEETADAMAIQGSKQISGKVVIVVQDHDPEQQAIG